MSEYIVEVSEWVIDANGNPPFGKCEQITRCRDCNLFDDHYLKCFRPVLYFDHDCNPHWTDETNFTAVTDATPDGYCAWGEPIRNHLEQSGAYIG